MLGLKKGIVKLVPHNPEWKREFNGEKKRLLKALGENVVDVEHVGSTAIPAIYAKPIIDIDVGVKDIKDAEDEISRLQTLGYAQIKNHRDPETHLVFAKGREGRTTSYLHLIQYGGPIWKQDLLFRDYLINNKERAKEYENLKKFLAEKYKDNRMLYIEGKEKFIQETIKLAGARNIYD
jgi:GrpB-like predicted nucleotidyltransferase (UPF0157 family)